MVSEKAYINPEILIWARKKRGFSIKQAADIIKIKEEKMKEVELGNDYITMTQLRKIANNFKRPTAAFYFQEVPEDYVTPDFRGLSEIVTGDLDIQVRKIMEARDDIVYINQFLNKQFPSDFIGSCSIKDQIIHISQYINKLCNFEKGEFRKLTDNNALNYWKDIVENIGILVFQFGDILPEETRGFSISNFPFPVIALNQKDTAYVRIFTIIHELTHILLNEPGICHSQNETGNNPIEIICNNVAAEVLMPADEIKGRYDKITNFNQMVTILSELSREFKVSYSVINYRFYNLRIISNKLKNRIFSEIEERRKPSSRGGDYYKLHQSRYGKAYLDMIFSAYNYEFISEHQISKFTGLTVKGIEHFQSKWERGDFK